MKLGDYLKEQHMEYCYQHKEMISEKEWVNEVLNAQLPPGEKIRYPSFNQWINNERLPDVRNMVRLMHVFGPEILTKLDVEFPADLAKVINRWDKMTEEGRQSILRLVEKNEGHREPATLQT